MIVDSFFSYLSANAGVAALCPETSFFPMTIPQGAALPAITYSLDADDRDQLLDSIGDLKTALFEVNAFSLDHVVAHQLAEAVETALAGYRGAFGSKTAEHIRLERKFELFETDTKLHRVTQQFVLAYY